MNVSRLVGPVPHRGGVVGYSPSTVYSLCPYQTEAKWALDDELLYDD
jgi:hypothetical protein